MALPLRIEYPGAVYHVMAHGNGFQWIYKSSDNIVTYMALLKEIKEKYNFLIHSFVMMRNHYHMLVETPDGNLSQGMKKLNRDFARFMNTEMSRKGSIFKHRYKAILIDKESYYLNVLRYIYQNPVRIELVDKAEKYPGSSLYYLAYKDRKEIDDVIYLETQKELLGKDDFVKKLIEYVNGEKEEDPVEDSKYKYLIGSEKWIKMIKEKYSDKAGSGNYTGSLKMSKREIGIGELNEKIKGHEKGMDIMIYILNRYTDLTQKEIGEKMKISKANTVGVRLKRFKALMVKDIDLQTEVKKIEKELLL